MRWARSYSIIDHELLHGGYLNRLSHEALILYLFLVVVGDREGRSFYGERTIMDIVRLSDEALTRARIELVGEGLIEYRRPYWWVRTISPGKATTRSNRSRQPDGMYKAKGYAPRSGERCPQATPIKDTIEEILSRGGSQG